MKDDCDYCWHSHGCDLPEGHEGEHRCLLTFSGDGGDEFDEPDFCDKCRTSCYSAGSIIGFYELCSTRPGGHPDVFHWKTFELET